MICERCAGCDWGCVHDAQSDELDDVLAFFKQLEVDAERCGKPIELKDVAERLGRGEHRV